MLINCTYVTSCNVKNPTNVDRTRVTAPPPTWGQPCCGISLPDALTPVPRAEGLSELIALKLVY